MIIAQLTIAPIGEGLSISKYVKDVIETDDLTALFNVVQNAHTAMINMGAQRVITELKIDDRRDKDATMESKLQALK